MILTLYESNKLSNDCGKGRVVTFVQLHEITFVMNFCSFFYWLKTIER